MDDAKLPDLSRVRDNPEPKQAVSPQTSAQDTSNWDDRDFTTPEGTIERELIFLGEEDKDISKPKPLVNPYLEQERVKSALRAKKKSK